jgi:hypothetical protein
MLAPKMKPSLWSHFVVDSMAIGSFLKLALSFSNCKNLGFDFCFRNKMTHKGLLSKIFIKYFQQLACV